MDAQGALDSLLGRLTSILVEEAQLLGRVRGDVEFIKEEMECMNSLILQFTEAQQRDHLVRSWMKQVIGLTRDCEGNVEHYIHYVGSRPDDDGLLGYLRRVLRFVRTIPVRHRIATRIRELKVRARDVGDRRQRYGVTVPASAMTDIGAVGIDPAGMHEHIWGRYMLLYGAQLPDCDELVRRGIHTLVKMLSTEQATEDEGGTPPPQVRVFSISGGELARAVADGVYQQLSCAVSIFGCKARSRSYGDGDDVRKVLADMLEQFGGAQHQSGQEEDEITCQEVEVTVGEDREKRLISETQGHLKGKRFLIILDVSVYISPAERILDALLQAADGCLPGSSIIMTTYPYWSPSLYKVINAWGPKYSYEYEHEFYIHQTRRLGAYSEENSYHNIIRLCGSDTFAMKTFLHLLYVNPNRTEEELHKYKNSISECLRLKRSICNQVLLWCYNELPSKYRSCLLYLSVFPEGHVIRTTCLARRWVAEGLISATTTSTPTGKIRNSSTEEAEHYLDVLFSRGFVSPVEICAADNIKSYTVHHQVREFIARVATDVNFVDSSLPPHLAHYLSIHNRLGLHISHSHSDNKDIADYLPYLAASPQWQLLKVLDLEGCKGLNNKKNLKSICKILLLKYLSLRSTDVTQLPKQINDLQCLETLDIRQTKVRILARKAIVLPLLKHFLAGDKISVSNDGRKSEEAFLAVNMPLGIHRMKNLEIVSHVQVTNNSSELTGIAELLKLRKLGVALDGRNAKLSELFDQIVGLHKCLRSLSVRIHQKAVGEKHDALTPPNFITSLNVCGLTSGLPHMIQQHHQLVKLTLTETYLKEDGLRILGKLRGLRFLRLLHKSYTESELSLKEEEFQTLDFLLVGTTDVTNISFAKGAAPKLKRIIWSFPTTACVSGLKHIHGLMVFELNGDCNPNQVRDEIQSITNSIPSWFNQDPWSVTYPVFKHNPHVQRQDDRAAAPASSSSAT